MTSPNSPAKYDAAYFIKKFEAIPDEKWTVGDYHHGAKSCALGHCGASLEATTVEGDALFDLFYRHDIEGPNEVNDGFDECYPQRTPKARILAALRDIQLKESK